VSKYRLPVSAAMLAAITCALPTPASADPPSAVPAAATCSDGNTYDAVVVGNGYFSPALVITSNKVFKPVAFGEFTTTVTDPDGVVVSVETAPAREQGGGAVLGRNPKSYLNCAVTITATVEDGFTVTVKGTVTGFLTPPRPSA
jgi:hypothetical protein